MLCLSCRFKSYVDMCKAKLFPKYFAVEHWAKIEPAGMSSKDLQHLRQRLGRRYPVADFNRIRRELDPKQILRNEFVDAVLPLD